MSLGSSLVFFGLALAAPQERQPVDVPPATHSVTACLVDARGNPVAHANVRVGVKPVDGSERISRSGASDAEGVVRFEQLPAGQLELEQNDFNAGGGPRVELSLETDVEHTFRLPGHLSLAGRIVGSAVSDPWLTLLTVEQGEAEGLVRLMPLGEDGRFTLAGLTPGVYRIAVGRGRNLIWDDTSFTTDVDLYESLAGVQYRIPALGSVELDFIGRGARPGLVSGYLLGEGDALQRGYFHHRDRLDELPNGRYRVVIHENLESRYGRRLLRDIAFELAQAELHLEIEVALLVAWARFTADELPERGIQGRLRLTDSTGHVLDDQKWSLGRAREGSGLDVDEVYHGQLGTGLRCQGDRFELGGLAPGTWTLHAESPGYASLDVAFEAKPDAVVDLSLERLPGRVVRARIADSCYEVFVRPAASDAPWELLLRDAGVRGTHTAWVGVFAAHLAPGNYEFRVHSRKFADALVGPLEIGDDVEPFVIPLAPDPGHALQGTLRLVPDLPIEAPLHLWIFADGAWQPRPAKDTRARVDADPSFTIQGLAPGRYRLTLDPAGTFPVGEFAMEARDQALEFVLVR